MLVVCSRSFVQPRMRNLFTVTQSKPHLLESDNKQSSIEDLY